MPRGALKFHLRPESLHIIAQDVHSIICVYGYYFYLNTNRFVFLNTNILPFYLFIVYSIYLFNSKADGAKLKKNRNT